jgi:hypothetical protein
MSKDLHTARASFDMGKLIERLGPLNNRWREADPSEKVLLLWDMGEIMLRYTPDPTDALLWDLQGRSYLTRNILRYALIVRRNWKQRSQLGQLADGLTSFTLFREALPYLKGDREGIDHGTYQSIIRQLRQQDTAAALKRIKDIKAKTPKRRHKKGRAVSGVRDSASQFDAALKRLEQMAVSDGRDSVRNLGNSLINMSQVSMGMASDEAIARKHLLDAPLPSPLNELRDSLAAALSGGRASVVGFRKTVGGERLMQAADLLNSLRSDAGLTEWKRRNAVRVSAPKAPGGSK